MLKILKILKILCNPEFELTKQRGDMMDGAKDKGLCGGTFSCGKFSKNVYFER